MTNRALVSRWIAGYEAAWPDEGFTLATGIPAVDGGTAVVRAEVRYAEPEQEYRDLWIVRFGDDGRGRRLSRSGPSAWPGGPSRAGRSAGSTGPRRRS